MRLCTAADGDVLCTAADGDVFCTAADGDVLCTAADGDVLCTVAEGYVLCTASDGDVLCTVFYCVGLLAPRQNPTWRTRVFLFVWVITLDLSGMGGPISSIRYRQDSSWEQCGLTNCKDIWPYTYVLLLLLLLFVINL
jgi:hypothetical protein